MKFLIVDDNDIDSMVMDVTLRQQLDNPEIFRVDNGIRALNWLEESYDGGELTILLDIMMPQMDGFQFIEKFKDHPYAQSGKITIYMISSTMDPRDKERAQNESLITRLIEKPFDSVSLLNQ